MSLVGRGLFAPHLVVIGKSGVCFTLRLCVTDRSGMFTLRLVLMMGFHLFTLHFAVIGRP